MADRIQIRRDTSTNWTSVNPVLSLGEPAYETNTGFRKIGDGTTAWSSLAYEVNTAVYQRRIYVDSYGADPTGVDDSTAAFNAALAAGGSACQLVLSAGTYLIGTSADLTHFDYTQSIVGPGSSICTINYVGNGYGIKAVPTTWSPTSNAGSWGGFTLEGWDAGSSAVGMWAGDQTAFHIDDVNIQGFDGASSTGLLLKNVSGYSEQGKWTRITLVENTYAATFDTSSWDYSEYDFTIINSANQNGITLQNSAQLYGVTLKARGNFNTTSGANTAYALGIDPISSGTSIITNSVLDISLESGTEAGRPTPILIGAGAGEGIFASGMLAFHLDWANSVNILISNNFVFSGDVSEPSLGGAQFSAIGFGAQLTQQGGLSDSLYMGNLYLENGDVIAVLLTNGNTSLTFNGAPTALTQKVDLYLKQPAAGSGTVTWPGNVVWEGGYSTLSTTNSAVDHIRLIYLPSESKWYANLMTGYAPIGSNGTNYLLQPGVIGAVSSTGITATIAAGGALTFASFPTGDVVWFNATGSGILTNALLTAPSGQSSGAVTSGDYAGIALDGVPPSSAGGTCSYVISTGTSESTAALASTNMPALTAGHVRLWDGIAHNTAGTYTLVSGGTGATLIPAATGRDRRPRAQGSFAYYTRTAGDYTVTTTTPATALDATNLSWRLECSGVPIKLSSGGTWLNSTGGDGGLIGWMVDGAVINGTLQDFREPTASYQAPFGGTFTYVPSAGSHLFQVCCAVGGGGTLTVYGGTVTDVGSAFSVRELICYAGYNGIV